MISFSVAAICLILNGVSFVAGLLTGQKYKKNKDISRNRVAEAEVAQTPIYEEVELNNVVEKGINMQANVAYADVIAKQLP